MRGLAQLSLFHPVINYEVAVLTWYRLPRVREGRSKRLDSATKEMDSKGTGDVRTVRQYKLD